MPLDLNLLTALDALLEEGTCGPLSDGPLSPDRRTLDRRTLDLPGAPRRLFPARVSRVTVAAAMLDEAETRPHPGQTLVPVDR